ncbi:MAG: ATP-dependent DNA helicase RecG [Gammaproteobacteria bacterium]
MTATATTLLPHERPVTALSGVGPALAEKLARIGIHHVIDLLFHLPSRYQDRTRVYPIGGLSVGQQVVVEGQVELTDVVFRGRRSMICHISDGSGVLSLRFFYFSNAQKAMLKRGVKVRCFGEVRYSNSRPEMIHPEYTVIKEHESFESSDQLTPFYPVTDGLQQIRMRQIIQRALKLVRGTPLPDWIPEGVLERLSYPNIDSAVQLVHNPPTDINLEELNEGEHPCQRRLAFDELVAHQLSLRVLRERLQNDPGIELAAQGVIVDAFIKSLPFTLTAAQARVIEEIMQDIELARPMLRLLQGDVGSGKTVVAAAVALRAIDNGYQVAFMAPTELLAEQHLRSLRGWLEPLDVSVSMLASKMPTKEKRASLEGVKNGSVHIAVGTHALFQDQVEYSKLGLVIIDEQHRFGVHQRLQLKAKGNEGAMPHQLVMTATPIPRTLAMSAYADLDVSVIDELPPGRTPIKTVVLSQDRRPEVVERISMACAGGQQAYWVCPLVNESEVLECEAAEATAVALQEALPKLRVGLIHGQLTSREKEAAMAKFSAHKLDLLVATTVIEVGVDVPNASLMVIENAERMGLAQLHQLRGRIGRGARASACVLLYKPPLKGNAKTRLNVIRSSTDGFEIAEKDLEIRGPGEVLGTRQTGRLQMRIADVVRDADLLPIVREAADTILANNHDHVAPLVNRWIAAEGRYGGV